MPQAGPKEGSLVERRGCLVRGCAGLKGNTGRKAVVGVGQGS